MFSPLLVCLLHSIVQRSVSTPTRLPTPTSHYVLLMLGHYWSRSFLTFHLAIDWSGTGTIEIN